MPVEVPPRAPHRYAPGMKARRSAAGVFAGIHLLDFAIAGAVTALGQQEVWLPIAGLSESSGSHIVVSVAYLVASLALIWRRRAPLTVLVVVAVSLGVQSAAFGSTQGLGVFLPGLFAYYAVGRYHTTGTFLVGTVLIIGWLVLHEWRDPAFELSGATLGFDAILIGSGFLGLSFQARAREIAEVSLRASRLETERAARDREAAAAERSRIARELHDIVGHNVSLIVLQLIAAQGKLQIEDIESTRDRLRGVETIARSTMGEMRRLVHVLDANEEASLIPQPGIVDIETLVRDIAASGVPIEYRVDHPPDGVSPGLALAVYRLVQEALTNVLKHADPPDGTHVTLGGTINSLTVEVVDRGRGPAVPGAAGRGLAGMKERVSLYGGTLDVGPRPGGGFRVFAQFPLVDEA